MSLIEKPEPETETVDPGEPELGLREIDGTVTGSVEVVETVVKEAELVTLLVEDEIDDVLVEVEVEVGLVIVVAVTVDDDV